MKLIRLILYVFLLSCIQLISCNDNKEVQDKVYIKKEFYNDGKLKEEISYKDSVKDGIVKEYYPNGSVKNIGFFKNDTLNGNATSYSDAGTVLAKAFFWKGKSIGSLFYYTNGHLTLYNERVLLVFV